MGYLLFGEVPRGPFYAASAIVVAGVAIVVLAAPPEPEAAGLGRGDRLRERQDERRHLAPEGGALGLEQHAGKERVGGELGAADVPGIIPRREPQAGRLQRGPVGGVEAVVAAVSLGGARRAVGRAEEAALLEMDVPVFSTREQLSGVTTSGAPPGSVSAWSASAIPATFLANLEERVLESPAGPEERAAALARPADGARGRPRCSHRGVAGTTHIAEKPARSRGASPILPRRDPLPVDVGPGRSRAQARGPSGSRGGRCAFSE